MLGAIIGDIVGSRFEFNNTSEFDFELFTEECDFTDDTICTVAVADAILNGKTYRDATLEWCRRYPCPMGSYGGSFARWIRSSNPQPYGSFGNGSAMRVSAIGWLFSTREEVMEQAKRSAKITHNHPEGVKGAQAIASAIFLAREGKNKEQIADYIVREFGYNLNRSCDSIRLTNTFDETCQGSCPEAIVAFMESDDFESAIRLAVSLGGDSDTIACMTGGIAAAYYGVPQEIINKAIAYLPKEMLNIIEAFETKCNE